MITVLLEVIAIILILYFASGAWCGLGRRGRLLIERDYREAEQWQADQEGRPPGEDALLGSLDLALVDGQEPPSIGGAEKLLSLEDQKA